MTLEPQAPQRCAALLLRRLRALQEAAEAWDPASAVVKVLAVANAEAGGGTAQVRSVQQAARNSLREAFDEFSQDFFSNTVSGILVAIVPLSHPTKRNRNRREGEEPVY